MSFICRACLQNVDKSQFFHIDTFDNNGIMNPIPKEILQVCVPEMDLYISDQPGICGNCLSLFQSFYTFKNRCLASEERIHNYITKYQIPTQRKVNLQWVMCDWQPPLPMGENGDPGFFDCELVNQLNESEDVVLINLNKASSDINGKPDDKDKEMLLLSCNECSFVTMHQEKLLKHKCLLISNPDKYKCPYCEYTSNRRYRLSYHVNAKHTKTNWFECAQCEYKTTDNSSLKRHQKVVHYARDNSMQLLNCSGCDFNTVSEVALQRHRVAKHGPVVQFCSHCPYQSKDKSNFRKHMFVHGDKPRKCTQCPYQCVSPYQLEKHFKRTHC